MEQRRAPLQEQKETTNYTLPVGFTRAEQLPGNEPSTVDAYNAQGLTGAEIGTYAQNNGTIAAIDSQGNVGVWIPKSDPDAPREVPYEKAIQSLEDAGYKKKNFYVPFSN